MKKTPLELYLQQGGAAEVTENFRRVQRYVDTRPQLENFKPISFSLQENDKQVKITHGLTFIPKDVILTRLLAPSGVKLILHHGLFTRTEIVVSASGITTGKLRARLMVGSFESDAAEDAIASDETQEYTSKI